MRNGHRADGRSMRVDLGGGAAGACELFGEERADGYPSTDEPVVECDSIVVPAGEVTALVGANGSGKRPYSALE